MANAPLKTHPSHGSPVAVKHRLKVIKILFYCHQEAQEIHLGDELLVVERLLASLGWRDPECLVQSSIKYNPALRLGALEAHAVGIQMDFFADNRSIDQYVREPPVVQLIKHALLTTFGQDNPLEIPFEGLDELVGVFFGDEHAA